MFSVSVGTVIVVAGRVKRTQNFPRTSMVNTDQIPFLLHACVLVIETSVKGCPLCR